jgi:hypothetical protein
MGSSIDQQQASIMCRYNTRREEKDLNQDEILTPNIIIYNYQDLPKLDLIRKLCKPHIFLPFFQAWADTRYIHDDGEKSAIHKLGETIGISLSSS